MCGIFGVFARSEARIPFSDFTRILDRLFQLSEARGKESAGAHFYLPERREAWSLKSARRATLMIQSRPWKRLLDEALRPAYEASRAQPVTPVAVLAHSRLVTNGASTQQRNNQPVRWGTSTVVHNGIIVNTDELWTKHEKLERRASVDTEILAALLSECTDEGDDEAVATAKVFGVIRGAASIAWVNDASATAVLATNTGDLYSYADMQRGFLVFASERFILEQALGELADGGASDRIAWLPPGRGLAIDVRSIESFEFSFDAPEAAQRIVGATIGDPLRWRDVGERSDDAPVVSIPCADESLLRYGEDRVRQLRRCTRCVLPETFPFIEFDANGICNYCASYRPRYRGLDRSAMKKDFLRKIEAYHGVNGAHDVLAPFSGGRDSSYGLHLITREFGFRPITFTYDWGMVTDLARRNVARMCGQLGVQNILVSADLASKRDNIRRNVAAWLRRPDLGMVPLFMAGDKHFFRIVNQLKKQTHIRLDLWSANPLENTDFKSGFCGVAPDFGKERLDYLSLGRKARMAMYYGARFLENPSYLNRSLLDTASAFLAYYVEPRRDFFFLFDHVVWDEREVNDTLLGQYDWELAADTQSTWRIGDGTAPFYNYIYMTARGFTEFDTFRSNQIREGMLTREQALASIFVENRPRPQSIRWYLDTIGLEFDATIRRINELDILGLHR